ncbi:SIAE-like protein [Mya arenaria]|uniref:SIAE-like protein n=1 Tax=Mya arenaria TaxID=6604 RepID=A0ABY7DYE3_MYAAR|nr:SIAE-like protein [Mya arenaria]
MDELCAIWKHICATDAIRNTFYMFRAMIEDWRAKFHAKSHSQTSNQFPFGDNFSQLAPWRDQTAELGFSEIRWAQTFGFGFVPNPSLSSVFMAVAMDLPDFASPYGA